MTLRSRMTLNLFNIPDNLMFIYFELSVISSEFDEVNFKLNLTPENTL